MLSRPLSVPPHHRRPASRQAAASSAVVTALPLSASEPAGVRPATGLPSLPAKASSRPSENRSTRRKYKTSSSQAAGEGWNARPLVRAAKSISETLLADIRTASSSEPDPAREDASRRSRRCRSSSNLQAVPATIGAFDDGGERRQETAAGPPSPKLAVTRHPAESVPRARSSRATEEPAERDVSAARAGPEAISPVAAGLPCRLVDTPSASRTWSRACGKLVAAGGPPHLRALRPHAGGGCE